MLNTYVVEGGVGKCIAFTALIPKLAAKSGRGVQVYTPYVDCFVGNQLVEQVFEQSLPLADPRILKSDNIFYAEPYKSNFVLGKQHLIESYCDLLGVEYEEKMVPRLFTNHLKERADQFLEKAGISGKYMLVQFTGGQAPIGWDVNNQYHNHMPLRNYPTYLAQQVVTKLKEQFPNVTIIDYSLPNEPGYAGSIQFVEHWAVAHELLKNAEGFIGIDSMLQHMSASAKTSGVVLWGQNRWTQYGYTHNKNMQFHMKDKWDESKYDMDDPRNVCVDPDEVVKAYKALIRKGDKTPTNIRCMSA